MRKIDNSKVSSKTGRYANRDTVRGEAHAHLNIVTLENVYNALQEMIFTKDINGRITSANDAYASRVSLDKSEIIGKTAFEMRTMPSDIAVQVSRADDEVLSTKKTLLTRGWTEFPDGARIYAETTKTPIIEDGEVKGVLVTIRDLTELKLTIEKTERQNKILETIGKVSELMLEPDIDTFEQAIAKAMEIIGEGINADRIDIWRLREKTKEMRYTLEYNWSSDKTIGNLFEPDESKDFVIIDDKDDKVMLLMESILIKGKSINKAVKDLPAAAREMFRANGIETAHTAMIMPINLNDEYWGFICAFSNEENRIFAENEELLLQSSRKMIASAMTRVKITRNLIHQTDMLRYELTTKRDFFARMSHEIRTPMNAILGMTELALRERMSNLANEHIMTVKQTSMNLLSIINDILDFSKIESGKMEVIHDEYAPASLIYDIVSIIRMKLAYTRIRFIADIDSNLPSELIGDEGKIRQILINLLGNAVKYTKKGFVRLTINGEVKDDDTLLLKMVVADSGVGIKAEDQERLFRDYIQVDKEKNIGVEGVGLGLSIAKGLVTAMDGSISLSSEYGKGSEFTVTIPQGIGKREKLAVVNNPEISRTLVYERRSLYVDTIVKSIKNLGVECDVSDNPADVVEQMDTGSYAYVIGSTELMIGIKYGLEALDKDFQIIGISEFGDESDSIWRTLSTPIHTISLANMYNGETDRYVYAYEEDASGRFSAPEARVLVVDDITTNLKVAAGLLSVYDVEIDICNSGSEAIEHVKECHYDVIFMDHRMPGMDGVETTGVIRSMGEQDEYYREVPIVALTANVMSNMREMFIEAGFNDFIAKPIDTIVLSNVMRKWIPKSKQRRYYATDADKERHTVLADTGLSITIPGVDVEKGFRTSGGRLDFYLDVLATFLDEAKERLTQFHEYIETGNLRMYTINAHALKGALANIGAEELSVIAAQLEAAGDRKDLDYLVKNNEHFVSGISRLLTNIKAVLTESAKSAGEGKEETEKETEQFVETLEELKTALEEMNAGTMNRAVGKLLNDALSEQSLSTVRLISKHILMAEYDDAEQIVGNLISAIKNRT